MTFSVASAQVLFCAIFSCFPAKSTRLPGTTQIKDKTNACRRQASNTSNQPSAWQVTAGATAHIALTLKQPSAASPPFSCPSFPDGIFSAWQCCSCPHRIKNRLFALHAGSFHTACRPHCVMLGTQKEPSPLCSRQRRGPGQENTGKKAKLPLACGKMGS